VRVVRVGDTQESWGSADLRPEAPDGAPDQSQALQLVLVRWHDAWFDPEQQTADDWRGDYLVHTVGFLVRRDAHILSVAQELLPDGDGFRAVTHIPASVVESVVTLFRAAGLE